LQQNIVKLKIQMAGDKEKKSATTSKTPSMQEKPKLKLKKSQIKFKLNLSSTMKST